MNGHDDSGGDRRPNPLLDPELYALAERALQAELAEEARAASAAEAGRAVTAAQPQAPRSQVDWHRIAFQLGRGLPAALVAELCGCSVTRIRRNLRRSARFRRLIREAQRHRAEIARRQIADAIAEVGPRALRRALEDGVPSAIAFAARQLAKERLGLEPSDAEAESEGAPAAAGGSVTSLVWEGDR